MSDESASELDLLTRWRQGDEAAATELFNRYGQRLIALARKRVAVNLVSRFDPEDVVQSAYRSFFAGARDGRYECQLSHDLWQLLVTITLRKLHRQIRWNKAGKRTVDREQNVPLETGLGEPDAAWLGQEPDPLAAVALVDRLQATLRTLSSGHRRMCWNCVSKVTMWKKSHWRPVTANPASGVFSEK
jgi:RNA polymerase sigma-70 factor (ECF subfamily)